MTKPNNIDPVDELLWTVWAAALDAKAMVDNEGATEADYIRTQSNYLARAKAAINLLMVQERLDEAKNSREGFVVGYQRYEGNENADKFLRTIIEAFDERIAQLQSQLTPKGN